MSLTQRLRLRLSDIGLTPSAIRACETGYELGALINDARDYLSWIECRAYNGDFDHILAEHQEPPPKQEAPDVQEAVEYWNSVAKQFHLPRVRDLSPRRREALMQIITEHGVSGWMEAVDSVRASTFLRGEKTDWRASFDFFLQREKFSRALEGFYDDGVQ